MDDQHRLTEGKFRMIAVRFSDGPRDAALPRTRPAASKSFYGRYGISGNRAFRRNGDVPRHNGPAGAQSLQHSMEELARRRGRDHQDICPTDWHSCWRLRLWRHGQAIESASSSWMFSGFPRFGQRGEIRPAMSFVRRLLAQRFMGEDLPLLRDTRPVA